MAARVRRLPALLAILLVLVALLLGVLLLIILIPLVLLGALLFLVARLIRSLLPRPSPATVDPGRRNVRVLRTPLP